MAPWDFVLPLARLSRGTCPEHLDSGEINEQRRPVSEPFVGTQCACHAVAYSAVVDDQRLKDFCHRNLGQDILIREILWLETRTSTLGNVVACTMFGDVKSVEQDDAREWLSVYV